MSVEENKALVRRFVEGVWNQGKLDLLEEFVAADFLNHEDAPGARGGPESIRRHVLALRSAFPDVHFTIEELIAEGDVVVVRESARGTNRGAFMGIPPTGQQMTFSNIHIVRLANGKLVEHWREGRPPHPVPVQEVIAAPA